MAKEYYKEIKVSPEHKRKFVNLAVKLNRKQVDLANQVIDFLDRNNIDPQKTEQTISISGDLKKLRDTTISFFRKQEKDIILPLAKNIDEMKIALAQTMHSLQPFTLQVKEELPKNQFEKTDTNEELKRIQLENNRLKHSLRLIEDSIIDKHQSKLLLNMNFENLKKLLSW